MEKDTEKDNIREVLTQRAKIHGDFCKQSQVAQRIKMRFALDTDVLPHAMREALDMIAVKISRILTGDRYEQDHWQDIAGYALLVVDMIELRVQEGHSPECTQG